MFSSSSYVLSTLVVAEVAVMGQMSLRLRRGRALRVDDETAPDDLHITVNLGSLKVDFYGHPYNIRRLRTVFCTKKAFLLGLVYVFEPGQEDVT